MIRYRCIWCAKTLELAFGLCYHCRQRAREEMTSYERNNIRGDKRKTKREKKRKRKVKT